MQQKPLSQIVVRMIGVEIVVVVIMKMARSELVVLSKTDLLDGLAHAMINYVIYNISLPLHSIYNMLMI